MHQSLHIGHNLSPHRHSLTKSETWLTSHRAMFGLQSLCLSNNNDMSLIWLTSQSSIGLSIAVKISIIWYGKEEQDVDEQMNMWLKKEAIGN